MPADRAVIMIVIMKTKRRIRPVWLHDRDHDHGTWCGRASGTRVERTGERAGWRTRLGELELLHRSRLRGRDLCNNSREWDGCDGGCGRGRVASGQGAATEAVAGERGAGWRTRPVGIAGASGGQAEPAHSACSLAAERLHVKRSDPPGSDLGEAETRSALDMEGGQYTPGDPHRPREQPAPNEPTPNSLASGQRRPADVEWPTPSGRRRAGRRRAADLLDRCRDRHRDLSNNSRAGVAVGGNAGVVGQISA